MVRHLNHNELSGGRESTRLVNLCNRDRVAGRGIVAGDINRSLSRRIRRPMTALRHD